MTKIILCLLAVDTLIYVTIGYCFRRRVLAGTLRPVSLKIRAFVYHTALTVLAVVVDWADQTRSEQLEEMPGIFVVVSMLFFFIVVWLGVGTLLFPIMFLSDRFLFHLKGKAAPKHY